VALLRSLVFLTVWGKENPLLKKYAKPKKPDTQTRSNQPRTQENRSEPSKEKKSKVLKIKVETVKKKGESSILRASKGIPRKRVSGRKSLRKSIDPKALTPRLHNFKGKTNPQTIQEKISK